MDTFYENSRHGYTVRVVYDIDPTAPSDWCTIGTLAYDTGRAGVGDMPRDGYDGRWSLDCPACGGDGEGVGDSPRCRVCDGYGYIVDGATLAENEHGAILTLPVYAADYGAGTTLRVAESWDEANGWIYATGKCSCGCGANMTDGMDEEQIRAALKSDLQTWEQWAQGDVYGIILTSPTGEELDSCWGFYGDEYAVEEANSWLDAAVKLIDDHPGIDDLVVN